MTRRISLQQHEDANASKMIYVGVCGYEARSVTFLDKGEFADFSSFLIFDYQSSGVASYDVNRAKVTRFGIELIEDSKEFLDMLSEVCRTSDPDDVILIDIASMDRSMLAHILLLIYSSNLDLSVRLRYFPAIFNEPNFEKLQTVISFGPVVPELSGTSSVASESVSLIVGAGYDPGKVVGSIDSLEPDNVFVFRPTSADKRYEAALDRANSDFDFLSDGMDLVDYDIDDPISLLSTLHSVIQANNRRSRLIVLPMGPKLFAAICVLLALQFHPNVRVWRYSTIDAKYTDVRDSVASGEEIVLDFAVTGSSAIREDDELFA